MYLLLLMVVNMYKPMGKVVIKILQGSAVTLTMLGGLTIHPPVANFLQYMCAKNYENWLAWTKLLQKLSGLLFLAHPVHLHFYRLTCEKLYIGNLACRWLMLLSCR